ncbi:MAG: acetyl ornithine aminotransferase family protein [Deltaproteobacteria bacterium]|nr:acetyl ornithine aminotransferase family protein [Deltaproteobacteria bacterium]
MALECPKIQTELPGPKAKVWLQRDRDSVSPSYTRAYPLVADRGEGCQIIDVDGNRFLDMTAGIAVTATGHCHPEVVAAIKMQAEKLLHMSGTDFYYAPQIELAERLGEFMPGPGPKKVFFCNSGAEAIEGAIKLARFQTKRQNIIGFYGAFHGRTLGALSVTASKAVQREYFFPLLTGVYHAPYPDPYRIPGGMTPEAYATYCVDWIRDTLLGRMVPPSSVAAILVEPMQGEGGYVVPPHNFHRELKALCEEHGILYIADEIQSGIGRTGTFFAIEQFGVVPDIITVAKGIASGLPLGAILSRAEIMQWPPGAHASTFGGNPVACMAALVTARLVTDHLMRNAATQGEYLRAQLRSLQSRHRLIGDVRGLGLMTGAELVRNPATKTRATDERNAVIETAFHQGLLLLGCGANAIRWSPPLTVTREELDVALRIFASALETVERRMP